MPGQRLKTDEVDLEHLTDVLLAEAKKVGFEEAFQFGKYDSLEKQHAISGRDLATQVGFLEELKKVSENLLLKYVDLKTAFTDVVRKYPQITSRFGVSEKQLQPGKFATRAVTLCTQCRRLKDSKKFQEACKGLPDYYVKKLEQLRNLVSSEDAPLPLPIQATPDKKPLTAGSRKEVKEGGDSWQDILEMEVPKSQLRVVPWEFWKKALSHPGSKSSKQL